MKKTVSRRKFIATSFAAAAYFAMALAVALPGSPAYAAAASRTVATVPLSAEEIKDLTFMREEEKLARDVYITLYATWRYSTFDNIAQSEQQHMDTMKKKLDKYGLPDPVQSAVGAFTNPELQKLYIDLVAIGSKSLIDALRVGCIIEETDVIDIQSAINDATHSDLDIAYQSLMDGSYSHLRAFVDALSKQGVTYVPQLISQELYEDILGL